MEGAMRAIAGYQFRELRHFQFSANMAVIRDESVFFLN